LTELSGVRLSQHGPQLQGSLLWPGRQEILIDCCTAHSSAACGGRMPNVSICSRLTESLKLGFKTHTHTHTHTHPFNGPFSGITQVSRYQKGKTNLDFTEARESEWQWHQLGHMQVCTLLQTDNHASTPPLSFYRPDALPAAQAELNKLLVRGNQRHCISDRNTTTSDITYIPRDDLLLGN